MLKGKSSKHDHLEYTEEDFQDFIRLAKDHPVFKSIEKNEANDYGRKAISSFLELEMCLPSPNPNKRPSLRPQIYYISLPFG